MPRTILIHLNVKVPDDKTRTAAQIAQLLFFNAIDGEALARWDFTVDMPLYEEV